METVEVTIPEAQVNALSNLAFAINQQKYPADIQKVHQDSINVLLNALNELAEYKEKEDVPI